MKRVRYVLLASGAAVLVMTPGMRWPAAGGALGADTAATVASPAEPPGNLAPLGEGKIDAVLGQLQTNTFVEAGIAAALARDAVSGVGLARVAEKRFKAADSPVLRAKLCWLLGMNGSPEAAAFLRRFLAMEKDVTVLSNALDALARCGKPPENVAAIRAFAGRKERPDLCFGYFKPVSLDAQVGELVGRPGAMNQTEAGEVVVEESTAHCIGLEWKIAGDDNLNCRVDAAYRKQGATEWRPAMPLLRVEGGPHPTYGVDPGNLLAGSVLFLEPGTEYEVRLTLSDPDGGKAEKIVRAGTRVEPQAPQGMRVRYVTPGTGGGSGTRDDPFKGIAAADAAAEPNDLFLLQAGTYEGPARLTRSGAADKPIVWRGADPDAVVIDGGGQKAAVIMTGTSHLFLERVTIRHGARVGVDAGNSQWIVFRRNRIEECPYVGFSAAGDCRYLTIVDNVITGKADWEKKGRARSSWGVIVNGCGHIIAHNRISEWWDCISLSSDAKARTRAVDVYENDLFNATDDGFEGDYVLHNVRAWRNRITNTLCALSCQPVFGGPSYYLFNEIYNARGKPLKFHVDPTGMIVAHNTCVTAGRGWGGGTWRNAMLRNNLILGTAGYAMETEGGRADLDYDGWNQPGQDRFMKFNNVRYSSLREFAALAGQETHGRMVGFEDFVKAEPPRGEPVKPGTPYGPSYAPGSQNLTLKNESSAVDTGVALPNVNDGFTGAAPDLGCYETGKPLPHYGPREE